MILIHTELAKCDSQFAYINKNRNADGFLQSEYSIQ